MIDNVRSGFIPRYLPAGDKHTGLQDLHALAVAPGLPWS